MTGDRKLVIGGVAAGGGMLLAAGLVLGAGIAKASPGEDVHGYLAALTRDGVAASDSAKSVDVGRGVCVLMNRGVSAYRVADEVARATSVPFTFAWTVAIDARDYLCPGAAAGELA